MDQVTSTDSIVSTVKCPTHSMVSTVVRGSEKVENHRHFACFCIYKKMRPSNCVTNAVAIGVPEITKLLSMKFTIFGALGKLH